MLLAHDPEGPPSAAAVHSGLQRLGLSFPRPRLQPLIETVSAEEGVHRAAATSVSALAAAALFLALLGVYGVMATRAERDRRDVGIRRALGAGDWSVVVATGRAVALPVVVGVGAGMVGAFAVDALVGSLVVGTTATDPRLLVALAAAVAASASLAALPPLLRAVRDDPVAALRDG